MATTAPRVLIAGGGIGGLTLAIAAARGGLAPIVLERFAHRTSATLRRAGAVAAPTPAAAAATGELTRAAAAAANKANATAAATTTSTHAAPDYRVGGGIGLWGPAVRALRSLSPVIDQQLQRHGQWMHCAGYRAGASGQWLLQPTPLAAGSAQAVSSASQDALGSCLCLHRDDLHRILSDALADAAARARTTNPVRFVDSATVEAFDDSTLTHGTGRTRDVNDFVSVRLSSGERVSGAVLVGADGLHSAVRAQLFPGVVPRYVGYRYARAVVRDAERSAQAAYESWGSGKRFGVVPLRSPDLFWFAVHDAPARPLDQATSLGSQRELEELKRTFADFHSPVHELLNATPASQLLTTDIYDLPCLPDWGRGHVTLLGDAAHAMAPNLAQGACNAIEDALSVASHLTAAAHQHARTVRAGQRHTGTGNGARSMGGLTGPYGASPFSDALRAYEAARKPRAHFIQRASRLVGVAGSLPAPWSTLRDTALRVIPPPLKTWGFNTLHRALLGWSYSAPNTGQDLYPRLLGDGMFERLGAISPLMKRFHTARNGVVVEGPTTVRRAPGLASWIATMMRLPPPVAPGGRVKVTVTHLPGGREWWYREFTDGTTGQLAGVFASAQWCTGENIFTESDGPLQFQMRLEPLHDPHTGTEIGFKSVMTAVHVVLRPWFPWRRTATDIANGDVDGLNAVVPGPAAADGPGYWTAPRNGLPASTPRRWEWRVPVPRLFWPEVEATTHVTPDGWRYDVNIAGPSWPLPRVFRKSGSNGRWSMGPIVHYTGSIDTVTPLDP